MLSRCTKLPLTTADAGEQEQPNDPGQGPTVVLSGDCGGWHRWMVGCAGQLVLCGVDLLLQHQHTQFLPLSCAGLPAVAVTTVTSCQPDNFIHDLRAVRTSQTVGQSTVGGTTHHFDNAHAPSAYAWQGVGLSWRWAFCTATAGGPAGTTMDYGSHSASSATLATCAWVQPTVLGQHQMQHQHTSALPRRANERTRRRGSTMCRYSH